MSKTQYSKVVFKFNVLNGLKIVEMGFEQALESDLGNHVKNFSESFGCTGGTVNDQWYGKVEIELVEG